MGVGSVAYMDKTEKVLLDSLHKEIIAALYIDWSRPHDVSEAVRAYDSSDVRLLSLFQCLLPTASVKFSSARSLYTIFCDQGFDDAEHLVTAERVKAMEEFWTTIVDLKRDIPELDARAATCFLVLAEKDDRSLAEQIIRYRWPGSLRQAQEILVEMKHSPRPLSSGSL